MLDDSKKKRRPSPRPTTKFQLCWYRATADGSRRYGIAWLNADFGTCDVSVIVDCETGQPAPSVWNYSLVEHPLSHIDIAYNG